jgi:hypothetical protein
MGHHQAPAEWKELRQSDETESMIVQRQAVGGWAWRGQKGKELTIFLEICEIH